MKKLDSHQHPERVQYVNHKHISIPPLSFPCQPPEMGDCEGKSSPFQVEVGDSRSPTSQLEHGKSPHDHVLDQQPMALPAESPPNKTAWLQTSKRHTEDNTEV